MTKRSNRRSAKANYPSLSDFRLHVKGRWFSRERQVLEIWYRGLLLEALDLGPARWAVLVILIHTAISAGADYPDGSYLNKQDIARLLRSFNSPFDYEERIKGYLHGLRKDLDKFLRQHFGPPTEGQEWGEILIPRYTLGYYIAVPPENLQLTILDRTNLDGQDPNRLFGNQGMTDG